MRRALAIDEKSFGPEHPYVARDLNTLALLLLATSSRTVAEPLLHRSFAIDEKSYGPRHPLARDLNNLAILLQATKRPAEAHALMTRVVAINDSNHGPQGVEVAIYRVNSALLLQATHGLGNVDTDRGVVSALP